GRRVREFTGTVIELTLAAADTAEIETKRGEIPLLKHVEQVVHDLVVHRAAELRMRMKHDRDRSALRLGRLVAALETACRTGENNLGHTTLRLKVGKICQDLAEAPRPLLTR